MTYTIHESFDHLFMVYRNSAYAITCVKTFKTRKAAENWVRKHS